MLNIEIYAGIKPIISLSGNIHDIFMEDNNQIDLSSAITSSFPSKYAFIHYGPEGFEGNGNSKVLPLLSELNAVFDKANDIYDIGKLLKNFLDGTHKIKIPVCIIFDCLLLSADNESIKRFFNIVYSGAKNSHRSNGSFPNSIIFINKDPIPLKEDCFVADIPIPLPTQAVRSELLKSIAGDKYDVNVVSLTEGMTLRDLCNINDITIRDNIDMVSAARLYLFRTKENPYLHCRTRFSTWEDI